MKSAVYCCIPCLATLPLYASCGKGNAGSDISIMESKDMTAQVVPTIFDSIQQRLQSSLDMEQISIPVEEWNDRTLCEANCINVHPFLYRSHSMILGSSLM